MGGAGAAVGTRFHRSGNGFFAFASAAYLGNARLRQGLAPVRVRLPAAGVVRAGACRAGRPYTKRIVPAQDDRKMALPASVYLVRAGAQTQRLVVESHTH